VVVVPAVVVVAAVVLVATAVIVVDGSRASTVAAVLGEVAATGSVSTFPVLHDVSVPANTTHTIAAAFRDTTYLHRHYLPIGHVR
jgi:hypothetical protein